MEALNPMLPVQPKLQSGSAVGHSVIITNALIISAEEFEKIVDLKKKKVQMELKKSH